MSFQSGFRILSKSVGPAVLIAAKVFFHQTKKVKKNGKDLNENKNETETSKRLFSSIQLDIIIFRR